MPKAVVDFSFPVRTSGKRKLMRGTNKDRSPEIKKAAMLIPMTEQESLYDSFSFSNVWGYCNPNNNSCGSWIPFKVDIPSQGTRAWERVGHNYFLKYFYLKGFIRQYAVCAVPCHWRLRLIRLEADDALQDPVSYDSLAALTLGQAITCTNKYLSMYYRNPRMIMATHGMGYHWSSFLHNFYSAMKTNDTQIPFTSKVIASGLIGDCCKPRMEGLRNVSNTTTQRGISYNVLADEYEHQEETDRHLPYSHAPFNVKVTLNDNIGFTYFTDENGASSYAPKVEYWLVLETDLPFGGYVTSARSTTEVYTGDYDFVEPTSGEQGVSPTDANKTKLFEILFQNIQYFTDD